MPLSTLRSRKPNQVVIDKLKEQIVWFYDEFLSFSEYQKERDGKITAELTEKNLQDIINNSDNPFILREEYEKSIH